MKCLRAAGVGNRLLRDLLGNPSPDDALVPENVELMGRHLYYSPEKAVHELGIARVSPTEMIAEFVR